ncbi:hypothetical protein AHiyo4_42390 [Arthrobacter sp. Hiyo4]|nr:hypothetical protein AHiyo4_42390 [Arthrobacter sp. Hiyo4]
MYLLLAAHAHGAALQQVTQAGYPHPDRPEPRLISASELAGVVRKLENRPREAPPRWIWNRTQDWYPALLAAGVELERCYDLGLCGNILAYSQLTAHTEYARNADTESLDNPQEPPRALQPPPPPADQGALFDDVRHRAPRQGLAELRAEYAAQQAALADAAPEENKRKRLQLLLAAESAGAMIAAEMQHTGVPWREDLHEQILAGHLGPRPPSGHRPAKLEALNTELRGLLNSPGLNPDSPQELMRALHRNGIEVKSTRQWELMESSHPAIAPLLAYKKLSRLHTANGWAWLDAWVAKGRFQPEYVVGGVVSGRWASRAAGPCRSRGRSAARSMRIPATSSSSRTPPSWNPECWWRWRRTPKWRKRRATRTCTPASPPRVSAATAPRLRSPCSAPFMAPPRANRGA